MKKFIKSQTALQIVACSVIATFVIAGVVRAASTIGANITTAGTLAVTGASTLTGNTAIGGTLAVTGASTLTGATTITGAAVLNGAATIGDAAADIITVTGTVAGASPLVFEGLTANDYETTIAVTDPTADRTITLPNSSGTVYITDGTDVAVADGGTGLSSYTAGDLIYASTATTLAKLASSSDATILMTNANGWPAWNAMSGDATISDAGAVTIADNSVDGTDIALASQAAGDIAYYNGTDWVRLASSTDGLVLTLDSNGWPSWAATIAALNNVSAWTASQKLDEGLTVDTTAFIVSGAGALTTTQVAALNGGITVNTDKFIVNGTTGATAVGGNLTIPAAYSLDTATGGALSIGTSTATSIEIADTGVMTTIQGTLNIDEAVTLDSTLGVSGALTMSAANEINLRDTALKIYSSVDGQLDIDADTEVEITATTVDLNGILDVSGALTITEGALTDSMVLSADIKNGEITTSDLSASAGITAAQLATASKTNTMAVRMADISTAETLYVMMPKCTVTKISTVLSGAITVADSTITASRNTDAMANGVVTIATSGSAAGVIDSASPTTNNTFDGSTQYLKLVGDGGSTDAAPVIVTIEYTMTD
ncbi:MAG: hypothetical protein V1891_00405 [bacterium]